ncbi:hypothetical protein [Vibrio barjaei]|uniref:hypothetical protein n=1 Tax=Vibrio barjaei TaxID=1676683 RepID=UPI002284A5A2|nr:hypothetical protein [Vibrio barjaei]MCY9872973.1 hypothetical protein [Vibrio barjaei]
MRALDLINAITMTGEVPDKSLVAVSDTTFRQYRSQGQTILKLIGKSQVPFERVNDVREVLRLLKGSEIGRVVHNIPDVREMPKSALVDMLERAQAEMTDNEWKTGRIDVSGVEDVESLLDMALPIQSVISKVIAFRCSSYAQAEVLLGRELENGVRDAVQGWGFRQESYQAISSEFFDMCTLLAAGVLYHARKSARSQSLRNGLIAIENEKAREISQFFASNSLKGILVPSASLLHQLNRDKSDSSGEE